MTHLNSLLPELNEYCLEGTSTLILTTVPSGNVLVSIGKLQAALDELGPLASGGYLTIAFAGSIDNDGIGIDGPH